MDILQLIDQRRSRRKYTEERVDRALLEKIVKAGQDAPSGVNAQNLRFTVVRDQAYFAPLQAEIGKAMVRENYKGFFNADTMIFISAPKESNNRLADTGCAMQNMMLAASYLGVGSCWVNQLRDICDVPAIRDILHKLEIPADHSVTAALALGMPAEAPLGDRENKTEVHWIE